MPGHDRVVVAVGGDRAAQVGADRLVEERDVGRSASTASSPAMPPMLAIRISVTASRVAAVTTNDFHVDTGESGVASSSTVRYSAIHVAGVIVSNVAAMGEFGITPDLGEPGEDLDEFGRYEPGRGDRRGHELDADVRELTDGGEVDVAGEHHDPRRLGRLQQQPLAGGGRFNPLVEVEHRPVGSVTLLSTVCWAITGHVAVVAASCSPSHCS